MDYMARERQAQPALRLDPIADNFGVWVDGDARGWHAVGVMVLRAIAQGFPVTVVERVQLRHYEADQCRQCAEECSYVVADMARRAEDWLNEWVAPAACYFGWADGDFVLLPVAEWHGRYPRRAYDVPRR